MAYEHQKIEKKWQDFWDQKKVFECKVDRSKKKFYALDMFPYPSASGLHVGHPEGYTASDIISRYKRAKGFNVLHPMGWDAFGLPAEQYAIQTGVHPSITTNKAIETFRRQLKSIGFSFDWNREVSTCDPKYYKWTQYLFLKLHEKGLAYQKEVPVNWCPALKTVLANEEVVDGKSERGGHPVQRIPMKQWMLKITSYAERLLKDLDKVDWPEGTKELQRNWIGKSEGLQFHFELDHSKKHKVEVYTTRPDTVFGATYLVLAPEHPLVREITTPEQKEKIDAYVQEASKKSELTRQELSKEKTGVFTGCFALHPFQKGKKVPVWISDYVLMGYGTGAIMAVPAHDERDFEFAKTFDLPIVEVVKPKEKVEGCFSGEGTNINSDFLDGLETKEAKEKIIKKAEELGIGKRSIQYKLRDWLFSRQRYWGEPFPLFHLEGEMLPVPEDQLPVALPAVESYEPTGTGESPLAAIEEWLYTTDPKTGKKLRRETDTMPGSAGSSWYFLRYCDPHNDNEPFSKESIDYWMPVDLYVGGPEHAVGHLLYSRFWTKVFYDVGLISVDEPFQKLLHQGMILGEDGEKMSKSRGNVINPDDVISEYGADTLRLYEMFMGPIDKDKPWSTQAIEGVYRFLQRFWRLFEDQKYSSDELSEEENRLLHKTVQKVTDDIENFRFNTAISQLMIFTNEMTKSDRRPKKLLKPVVQLLQPLAPHMAEELWEMLGEKSLLSFEPWPTFDPKFVSEDQWTIAIQVLGKTRGTVQVPIGSTQDQALEEAKKLTSVQNQIEGKQIRKVIFVPGKILNLIVG